jgi:hypothetical protein
MARKYALIGAAAAMLIAAAVFVIRPRLMPAQAVNVPAWTISQTIYNSANDVVENRTTYRRHDGTQSQEGTFPAHPERGTLRKVTAPGGAVTSLIQRAGAKMTGRIPPEDAAARSQRMFNPPDGCLWPGETALGKDVYLAQIAYHVRVQGYPHLDHEEWRAPSMTCFPVRVVVRLEQPPSATCPADQQLGSRCYAPWFRVEPNSVEFGQPAAEYFTEAGFIEQKPSDVFRSLQEKAGSDVSCPDCPSPEQLKQADADYAVLHARK